MPSPEEHLTAGDVVLGEAIAPIGKYSAVAVAGQFAFTSGIVALTTPGFELVYPGRFGVDLAPDEARLSARGAMLCTLANLRAELGSLDAIERFARITGYVQTGPSADGLPAVLNGASEVVEALWGPELLPARSAIGVAALPGGASVELECVVLLR
jgi:enamine deaminase RidA (YjgF/YER057c/UK114 family)